MLPQEQVEEEVGEGFGEASSSLGGYVWCGACNTKVVTVRVTERLEEGFYVSAHSGVILAEVRASSEGDEGGIALWIGL